MDGHQAMMKADGDFVGRIAGVLNLVMKIIEQLFQLNGDIQPIDADVLGCVDNQNHASQMTAAARATKEAKRSASWS